MFFVYTKDNGIKSELIVETYVRKKSCKEVNEKFISRFSTFSIRSKSNFHLLVKEIPIAFWGEK